MVFATRSIDAFFSARSVSDAVALLSIFFHSAVKEYTCFCKLSERSQRHSSSRRVSVLVLSSSDGLSSLLEDVQFSYKLKCVLFFGENAVLFLGLQILFRKSLDIPGY